MAQYDPRVQYAQQPPAPKRGWDGWLRRHPVLGGLGIVSTLLACLIALGVSAGKPPASAPAAAAAPVSTPSQTQSAAQQATNQPAQQATTPAPAPSSPAPAPSTSAPSAPSMSVPQEQAVEAAQEYLSMGSGFSYNGLLQQLTSSYGSGFSQSDAKFAISYLHPDWYQQAVMAAKGYMQMGGFSRESLLEQLTSSYGNGFTLRQATYAVNQVGL